MLAWIRRLRSICGTEQHRCQSRLAAVCPTLEWRQADLSGGSARTPNRDPEADRPEIDEPVDFCPISRTAVASREPHNGADRQPRDSARCVRYSCPQGRRDASPRERPATGIHETDL